MKTLLADPHYQLSACLPLGLAKLAKLFDLKDVAKQKEATAMYCPACGTALARQMKYCNRCGSQVITTKEAKEIEASEKRLREEMIDIFWVTVFGLGLILGGMALIKNVLHLREWILVAYMIISSTAFTINFGLSLWQIRRLARIAQEARGKIQLEQIDTNELTLGKSFEPLPSVTENTTRTLEPISKEQIT